MRRHVRRRTALAPVVAVLTALAAGCSAGSGTDGSGTDPKPGESNVAAEPGRYRSLPEPCSSVDGRRLKAMLPAAASLTTEQREQLYAGRADVSYDGDRRIGCRWKAASGDATRLLFVGYERVVSYDPATSDDDKARQVYDRLLAAAHLPVPAATASGSPSAGTPSGTPSPGAPSAGAPSAGATAGSGAPSAGASGGPTASGSPAASGGTPSGTPSGSPALGSRALDDLGEDAFLEDRLTPAGPTSQTRTVHLVFRSSNVIVTVDYTVQPAAPSATPDAEETQDSARELAAGLADALSE
ncbi:DUF3558 domain-containing protein [Streptomyces sp. NPDC101118]|uniref:DUF3558 domain-containing protein n=1 Tax=Streptomyces sp. NPDC101118 TaxID=3366109 RepID=UPI003821BE23